MSNDTNLSTFIPTMWVLFLWNRPSDDVEGCIPSWVKPRSRLSVMVNKINSTLFDASLFPSQGQRAQKGIGVK